jgi:AAHS family 4-hydroxybenzoate transporter-like MFS transporter
MSINVGKVLDEGRWTLLHTLLILAPALAIIMDGVDIQLLGNAVPELQKAWGTAAEPLHRSHFEAALSIGLIGMMVGGAVGGWVSDHIGRRNALVLCMIAFGTFTAAMCLATSPQSLVIWRFLAGLGLGGGMPTAAALASEYVPRRYRHIAVTLTIVCVPLGGMLAAQLSRVVLHYAGWKELFLIGGGIPFVLAGVMSFTVPESPRYLARRPHRWPELARLLRRLGHEVPADAQFTEGGESTPQPQGRIRDLLAPGLRGDTLALFGAFFFCLLVNYVAFLLLPTALTEAGFARADGNNALFWWNLGGVGGALVGAFFIHQLGSRLTMLGLSVLAIAGAFVMAAMNLHPDRMFVLLLMCVIVGGTLNAVQTTMYALAAHVYPTSIRGTGIGCAVAIGRIGGALAPSIGFFALGLARGAGERAANLPAYFASFGIGMIVVFVALALVRRHIERAAAQPAPAAVPVAPGK